jgi:hypothetical protein
MATVLYPFGVFHITLLFLFDISATGSLGSYQSIFHWDSAGTQKFSFFRCIRCNIRGTVRILSLRGGVEEKESAAIPFGGPNPKDEFDTSDEETAAQPKSDTIYVPRDVKSVPEAVEVHSLCISKRS